MIVNENIKLINYILDEKNLVFQELYTTSYCALYLYKELSNSANFVIARRTLLWNKQDLSVGV